MIATAPDKLRADFQRFYGLDLDEVGYSVRVRRAADLAANLPEQATIWRVYNKQAVWDTSEHLLADMADSLRALVWSKTKDASRRGARFNGSIPRPWEAANGEDLQLLDVEQADELMRKWYPNMMDK